MNLGTHAWRVARAGVDAERAAATFGEAVGTWWPRWSGRVRLWTEPVPGPPGSAVAERRRAAELRRPVDPVRPLRAVLLEYAGGPAELVLVADRTVLDAASLRMIAEVVLGDVPITAYTVAREPAPVPADGPAPGPGDRHTTVRVALPGRHDPAPDVLAAATSLVLGRYEGTPAGEVVLVTPAADRPDGVLGTFDVHPRGRGPARALVVSGPADASYEPCPHAAAPLTVTTRRIGSGWWIELGYRPADVGGDAAERLAEAVARACAQLADGVAEADVDLLGEAEQARLDELAGPAGHVPRARIEELFDECARAHADAPALTGSDSTLTYRQLGDRAARLAGALRARGVRTGDRVGICLERSPELVITMLAVLMAGAVYVPIDPYYPDARLEYTIGDAGLRVVVTHRTLPADVVTLGPEAGDDAEPVARIRAAEPDAPAYVIYTSGSTGRPKGVVVPHVNVAALVAATRADLGLGADDVWTLFHSSAFDFSVWEIWGALLTGGRLVVVPYWTSRSPEDFHVLLARERVTVLNQTPSAFTALMEADRRGGTRLHLRLVIFGGEPLDPRSLLGWLDRYPEQQCRLVNMFGITETTVHVTAETVSRAQALNGSRSVGRALPGWQVSVRDSRGRAQPVGIPGEIWVGGAGVALGYLGRPELTAERFVPDSRTGARMYRSGDLGVLRSDGRLEHLGRIDSQVKIRGFRIELDEIRAVLQDAPGITAAAVVVRDQAGAGARIDAYVTPAEADVTQVRAHAATMLPDYMVPASVTSLVALPLTINGKLDTAALPAPSEPEPVPETEPSADLRTSMVSVWQEVLGVAVTAADNFFELGGNSLAAVRIAALMRDRGLPRLPLQALYRNPTVETLAEVLSG